MFAKVIVGVDASPNGRDAVALAGTLAAADATITLMHVRDTLPRVTRSLAPQSVTELEQTSRELLEAERAATAVSARLASVEASSPGRGLHEEAEREGADLIVVGSCGRGLLGRVFAGDDTRAALNGAPCAVAVAARGYAQREQPPALIGVGFDDGPESRAALAVARVLAARTGAAVHALEAVSLPLYAYNALVAGVVTQELIEDAGARLAAIPDVVGHAVSGFAGEELAIWSGQLDLLVIGSRGYGPLRRLVLGSTAQYLERHARSSLLVLPRVAATPGGDATAPA